ncbi:MAG: SDR family oxidoreductase [Fuerstiella sp.]|nr:SDR family oxidoreductase [Fuerstiella sp.]
MPGKETLTPTQRVALITGSGADRVGNRIARMLVDDGFEIALHYHSSKESAESTVSEICDQGGTAQCFAADVTSETDVDRLIADVIDRFGRLDLLVNTASQWSKQPIEEVTAADVLSAFKVDGLGTFLCARRAGLLMARQAQGGCIVNIGDASMYQPRTGEPAYYLAKATIPTLTRMLAVEMAALNPAVRVNAVLAGSVMAPNSFSKSQRQQRQTESLTQMVDHPASLANAIRYLAESPAVTGTCLTIDGGRGIRYAGNEN